MSTKVKESQYEDMKLFHINGNDVPSVIGFNTDVKNIKELLKSYFNNIFFKEEDHLLKKALIEQIIICIKNSVEIDFNILLDNALREIFKHITTSEKEEFILKYTSILEEITKILIQSVNLVIQKLKMIFEFQNEDLDVSFIRIRKLSELEGWHQNYDYLRCNLYLETSGYNLVDFMLNENKKKNLEQEHI